MLLSWLLKEDTQNRIKWNTHRG